MALAGGTLAGSLAQVQGDDPPPIVQPGAPGEPSRIITPETASDLASILYTAADVAFMQGMIAHHAQALEMTELIDERTQNPEMRALGQRIELSQEDEISMMQDWLRERGEQAPDPLSADEASGHAGHGGRHDGHGDDGEHLMPGMLTAAEMAQLAAAQGPDFDRLFLELMIAHHRGALVMVDDLLEQPGAAQESTVFAFTSDVVADQSAEIDRMGSMLAALSPDPRVGLAAGFHDAEQSAWNLELVAALPKPPGFFSPEAPQGVPIPPEEEDESEDGGAEPVAEAMSETEDDAEPAGEDEDESEAEAEAESSRARREAEERRRRARTSAILNFANSDIAFRGNVLFEGSFHGFKTWNVEDPTDPRLLAAVVCPGGQGDVSVVGDLLIMSVEQTRGRLDCGLQGVAEPVSDQRFRGVRIFDISDLSLPRQVAAVQTCRGSHTHTVVNDPDDAGRFYVYGSGTSSVRSAEELEGCSDAPPGEDEDTALFSIDVIEVEVAAPDRARVVNRPRIFSDPETGFIAGLWRGGAHGTGTQRTSETNQCHDITVFPDRGLAAGACSGNGILLDVSDPVNPVRLDQVLDPGFAYWHSATFNNDGTKVVFTDEWGGGMRPRCRASDPKQWGANAIFDIEDGKLEFRSYYKLPAPQSETENCVAHNGSLVPIPGRDVMVQAWYQGGVSVFDFTDSANPYEIAFFDRGPIDAEDLLMGGHWSAYWHDGHVYATEIARGLDVLRLVPSEHLSQAELDAAASLPAGVFNPQMQRRIEWPDTPVVARAYLSQLTRAGVLGGSRAAAIEQSLEQTEQALADPDAAAADAGSLATRLQRQADEVESSLPEDAVLAQRSRELARVLRALARGLAG
ncbi:MAG: DUF305 domain-containing protein [Acidobacteria bacterium]|nr:MAG: DUF305 domain-containing protein [Acidobacteriota bacterium]REK06197.1 MAG: DUF305 domain-containing protein [Acidobacteriota bacterium]